MVIKLDGHNDRFSKMDRPDDQIETFRTNGHFHPGRNYFEMAFVEKF